MKSSRRAGIAPAHARGALHRRPVGDARRDSRVPAARRRAPESRVRRARRNGLHRGRARRRARARHAGESDRPPARTRHEDQAHPGRRVPGHVLLAVRAVPRLTAGWEPADGRTLFLVGDPMQSIYRFREAKVALFLQAWEEGIRVTPAQPGVALERLTLTTNFRSQRGLVDWYNAFPPSRTSCRRKPTSPQAPSHTRPPRRSTIRFPTPPSPGITLLPQGRSHAHRRAGARSLICHRHQGHPRAHARGARRDRPHAESKRHPLPRDRDRAPRREAGRAGPLRPHARSSTPATASPGFAPPRALARASAGEAAGDFSDRTKTIWERIKDDLFLADFTRILAPAVANRERGTLRERVEGVWLALGGPACVADKTELEDAERYLDELENLEEQGPHRPHAAPRGAGAPLRAPRRRRHRRRPPDHDHPQGQGPGVRHRDRAGLGPGIRRWRHRLASLQRSGFSSPPDKGGASLRRAGVVPRAHQTHRRRNRPDLPLPARPQRGRRRRRVFAAPICSSHARRAAPAPHGVPWL